jgi:hypothetical protein
VGAVVRAIPPGDSVVGLLSNNSDVDRRLFYLTTIKLKIFFVDEEGHLILVPVAAYHWGKGEAKLQLEKALGRNGTRRASELLMTIVNHLRQQPSL